MKIMNNNIVFVVLDALRGDHVNEEYMPFLTSLKKDSVYIEDLNVSSGFCERAEIFFGQCPRESGFVHAISPNSDIKPYAWLSNRKAKVLTFFENSKILKKVLRRLLWKYSFYLGNSMYPQRIPLSVIRNFGFTEDSLDFEEYAKDLKKGLLFKIISLGYKVNWKYFTSLSSSLSLSDNQRLQEIPIQLSLNDNHFFPVYIGTPDAYGHKFGPHSKGLISKLGELDNKLKEFYFNCREMDSSVKLCFLGDHGMETVTQVIDLKKEVESTAIIYNLKEGLDYSIFVDSTSIRFWFHKKSNSIENFISAIKKNKLFDNQGYFLNDNLCAKEKLPNSSEIADIVWWARKGVQIAPDYFHDEPEGKLGMHGYLKVDGISSGFVIYNSQNVTPLYKETCDCHELSEILL